MLSQNEKKLLNSDLREFPMMAAASASIKRCGKCGHGNINPHTLLRAAATRYLSDDKFLNHLKKTTGLPVIIGGFCFREKQ